MATIGGRRYSFHLQLWRVQRPWEFAGFLSVRHNPPLQFRASSLVSIFPTSSTLMLSRFSLRGSALFWSTFDGIWGRGKGKGSIRQRNIKFRKLLISKRYVEYLPFPKSFFNKIFAYFEREKKKKVRLIALSRSSAKLSANYVQDANRIGSTVWNIESSFILQLKVNGRSSERIIIIPR